MPTAYKELMENTVQLVADRGMEYGEIDLNFRRASVIASTVLAREVTKYEIAIILDAVKMARAAESPLKADHYMDGINYRAFAAMFASEIKEDLIAKEEEEKRAEQERLSRPMQRPLSTISQLPAELVRDVVSNEAPF